MDNQSRSNNNTSNNDRGFYQLTPDQVLDAIESVGIEPEAALLALNSYENRVYQFRDFDNQRYVVKFYRPNRWSNEAIIEEHDFSLALAKQEIPVVAPIVVKNQTLFTHQNFRFAIYPSQGGRSPNLDDKDTLMWLGRFLGRIHLLGETQTFKHRPTLTLESFGVQSVDYLLKSNLIPSHIFEAYQVITKQLLEACNEVFANYGELEHIRLHGDCHPSNVLWSDDGPHFVDFDDSRNGASIQDFWMLINDNQNQQLWNWIIEGYEDFREFDDRQLKLVEPLRTMRMLHYSAWLAKRWQDPSFKINFPWFNSTRYWEEQVLALKEQLANLQHS